MATSDATGPPAAGGPDTRRIHPRLEHPLRKLARAPRTGALLLKETPAVVHRAARLYGLSPVTALRRLRQLYARRFTPAQGFLLGLFDPAATERELDSSISNHTLHSMQELVNPRAWEQLTEDKAVFYRYCETAGLPIPRLYALYFKSIGVWTGDRGRIADRSDWEGLLRSLPREDFVLKPAWGSYGRGILLLRRSAQGWADQTGRLWSGGDLTTWMEEYPGCDHFILQERLRSHPEVNRISPSDGLQTARVITYIDRSGRARIIYGALKLIAGDWLVDNFASGRHGNIYMEMDVETGVVREAVMRDPARGVLVEVARHPGTDVELPGTRVPAWKEICDLALRAASAFLPVRTIGWDIAPTGEGPRLVEGNMWYDAPPLRGCSGEPVPFDLIARDTLDPD
jgi:hypothetical protein